MMYRMAIGLVLLCLTGCAFKGESESEKAASLNALDGSLSAVSISWEEGGRKMSLGTGDFVRRERLTWVREAPVSLPAVVPEQVNVELSLRSDPQTLHGVRAEANSISGEGIGSHVLGVEKVEVIGLASGSMVRFSITGLPMLLSSQKEQRTYLAVQLTRGSEAVAQVRLAITTPPSELTLLRRETRSQILEAGKLPLLLSSQALKLSLIERAVFKNYSPGPISLTLPFRVQGQAVATLGKYSFRRTDHPNPHIQRHEQVEESEERTQATDLFVIPGVDQIQDRWPEFSAGKNRRWLVAPGEEIEIGFYAPMSLNAFLAPLRALAPSTMMVSVDGSAKCPSAPHSVAPFIPESKNGDEGRWYCMNMNKIGWSYSDEAIAACSESIRLMRICVGSGWEKEACNRAALADDRVDQNRAPHPDNRIPWPLWFGCRRHELTSDNRVKYIHVGWEWLPILGQVFFGEGWKAGSLRLLDADAVTAELRFETGHADADAEARVTKLFANEHQITGVLEQ